MLFQSVQIAIKMVMHSSSFYENNMLVRMRMLHLYSHERIDEYYGGTAKKAATTRPTLALQRLLDDDTQNNAVAVRKIALDNNNGFQ